MRQPSTGVTRRRFLRAGALATAAGLMSAGQLLGDVAASAIRTATRTRRGKPRSVVVRAQSEIVSNAVEIRLVILREMFAESLKVISATDSVRRGWLRFLHPDDIIGINLDSGGAGVLSTTGPLAGVIVKSLVESGWPPQHLVVRGAPAGLAEGLGVRTPRFGWSESIRLGEAQDQVSSFVQQVSAIINVPLLMDDNLLGLSCSLKNATYALLKHPGRYHYNGGVPQLADLYQLADVRGKIRLNIVNGLCSVYTGGPLVEPSSVDPTGVLLMGSDAVAVDAVALEVLNAIRATHHLPALQVPLLEETARRGLGHADFRKIQRLAVTGL